MKIRESSNELLSNYLIYFAPDNSGKLRDLVLYFFLETAERPEEAPASSLEKRELNENLQRIAGIAHYFIYY
jgi:hypothetical protein